MNMCATEVKERNQVNDMFDRPGISRLVEVAKSWELASGKFAHLHFLQFSPTMCLCMRMHFVSPYAGFLNSQVRF